MRKILGKIRNRALYYASSGSPLRYGRKLGLYTLNLGSYGARKQMSMSISLSPALAKKKEDLVRTGFADFNGEISLSILEELIRAAEGKLKTNQQGDSVVARKYFGELLCPSDLQSDSIFVRTALQKNILEVATAYFDQAPLLFSVSTLVSKPIGNNSWHESQLWHRDYDDSKILKLFIYLNDVLETGTGPFTFVPAAESRRVGRKIIPRRVSDQEMEAKGAARHARSILGKSGTAFLVDTHRCYHMGSRCTAQNRLAYIATFTTMAPMDAMPYPIRRSSNEKWSTFLIPKSNEEFFEGGN